VLYPALGFVKKECSRRESNSLPAGSQCRQHALPARNAVTCLVGPDCEALIGIDDCERGGRAGRRSSLLLLLLPFIAPIILRSTYLSVNHIARWRVYRRKALLDRLGDSRPSSGDLIYGYSRIFPSLNI
jgi:hypothetical protein